MARRPRILFPGAIYHVTFRGNGRQDIFLDAKDRRRMLERLGEAAERHQVDIFLYCLMSNHVHLIVQTSQANLDRFMGSLLTAYTVYFNRKHGYSGHLMQGRYGAKVVSGDTYLLNVSRYIHLNPVHIPYWEDKSLEEKRSFLQSFIWSSYPSYIGAKPPEPWLKTEPILAMIPTGNGSSPSASYQEFIEQELITQDQEFLAELQSNRIALGPESFVAEMKQLYARQSGDRVKPEDAVLRREIPKRSPERVKQCLANLKGFNSDQLAMSRFGRFERTILAMALHRFSGLTQREIAPHLNLNTGAAVSVLMRKHHSNPKITSWMQELDLYFKG